MSEPIKTVMIVDDEISIRQSFAYYFEDHLWRILQAESGEQALELLKKESPDAAVVDIRMKGMDGSTFIQEAYKKKPKMAFIICTGSSVYDVPAKLQKLPCVSTNLFRKPLADIAELEKDLFRLIANTNDKKE